MHASVGVNVCVWVSSGVNVLNEIQDFTSSRSQEGFIPLKIQLTGGCIPALRGAMFLHRQVLSEGGYWGHRSGFKEHDLRLTAVDFASSARSAIRDHPRVMRIRKYLIFVQAVKISVTLRTGPHSS